MAGQSKPTMENESSKVDPNAIQNSLIVNLPQENPESKGLRDFLLERVANFYKDVVEPMNERDSTFPMGKTRFFFEIYKEGLEANKLYNDHTFSKFFTITEEEVNNLVAFVNKTDFKQLCELGSSFVINSFFTLQNWCRDIFLIERYSLVYGNGSKPLDWIDAVVENEKIFQSIVMPEDVTAAIQKLDVIIKCDRTVNNK